MQIDVVDAGPLRKQLTITYTAQEFAQRQEQLLGRYADKVQLKGFRKGRVPKGVVSRRFGDAAQAEATEALISEATRQAVSEHGFVPIGGYDSSEPETDDGLHFVTSFDIRPPITLPDPSTISLSDESVDPDEAEVEAEVASLLRRNGTTTPVPEGGALCEDDSITLSGAITAADGAVIREVHDLKHLLGGYPLFGKEPQEVMDLVKGLQVGDTLAFETTLPDTFRPEEWAGKEARVAVALQAAERLEPAAIDADLLERLGVADADALNERVREMLRDRKRNELRGRQNQELIERLLESCTFDLPQRIFEDVVAARLDQTVQRERSRAADEAFDVDAARVEAEPGVREECERSLRQSFICEVIAETHAIETTQQDLQQQIMMAAYQSGRPPAEIVKTLQENGQINQIAAEIREAKALEFFLSRVLGEPVQEPEAAPSAAVHDEA